MDLVTLAKYPFLQAAKEYIKEQGPSVDELLHDRVYDRARVLGIERLDQLFTQRKLEQRSMISQTDCIMEILSYPLARMIAICIGDSYFIKRYALGEAYHGYQQLLDEPATFVNEVAQELELHVRYDERQGFSLFFKDYLRHAPTRYKEWKLVNRTMDKGFVQMTQRVLCRVILETLRQRLIAELSELACNQMIVDVFLEDIRRLQTQVAMTRKKMKTTPVGKFDMTLIPPCLKQILAAIQAGENVPHMGRFALVAFLSSLKLSTKEILQLFSTAPDYEEDKTRYQVEHITGTSSSTAYKSPGCDKMRTYGLCPTDQMDEICKRIHHPLGYYNKKWRQEKKQA